jgi:hypothetical protein
MTKITNPNEVKFTHAPVYNLQTVRKLALALIVKSSQDPKKVAAIAETLEVLQEFLVARAEQGVVAREASIAAEAARKESVAQAAAEAKLVDAQHNLAAAEEGVAKWKGVLKDIMPAKKAPAKK